MKLSDKLTFLAWIANMSHTLANTAVFRSWLNKTVLHRKAMYVVTLDRNLVKLTKQMEQ